jgi:hypothetical protein
MWASHDTRGRLCQIYPACMFCQLFEVLQTRRRGAHRKVSPGKCSSGVCIVIVCEGAQAAISPHFGPFLPTRGKVARTCWTQCMSVVHYIPLATSLATSCAPFVWLHFVIFTNHAVCRRIGNDSCYHATPSYNNFWQTCM